MNNLQMWSLLVGALLPPFVAIIQQPKWPSWFRAAVTAVTSIFAGLITVWLEGEVHFDSNLIGAMLTVGVAALASYRGFWKPTNIAPTIEKKTS